MQIWYISPRESHKHFSHFTLVLWTIAPIRYLAYGNIFMTLLFQIAYNRDSGLFLAFKERTNQELSFVCNTGNKAFANVVTRSHLIGKNHQMCAYIIEKSVLILQHEAIFIMFQGSVYFPRDHRGGY